VLHTLELAFSALAGAAGFEEGVAAVLSRGGDTGTNACVAGALLGARFGKSRIPERWLSKLKVGPELTALADELYGQIKRSNRLGCQVASAFQRSPVRTRAFRMTSSFRMHATSATLPVFPLARRES